MKEISKKKILHVVGGMNVGGTETMLMNLYRKVNKDIQFDFISYYEKEGHYDSEIESLGGKVIKIKAPNKAGLIKSILDLKKVIEENGPYEAVHAHTLFNCGIANLAAKISGVKVRVTHAHTTLDNNDSFIKKMYISTMRKLIKCFSTDFLACSNGAGKYLFGENIKNNKRYKVLPNYIDYREFLNYSEGINLRKELSLKDDEKLIVHIGRFMEAKNHKFLVKLIKDIVSKDEQIKAIFVGDGHLRNDVENQAKELGLEKNILFLGIRKDISNILNCCDLFILPSIYEGLGLVMLEAQASGLPCLVSEAIQPEADLGIGLVKQIKLDDGIDKWADEALKLIGKKNNNKEAIEEAFKAKGYEIEDIVNILLDVYKIDIN